MLPFRLVAQWRASRLVFLVTLGDNHNDCLDRLFYAFEDYNRQDIENVESCWSEEWVADHWEPREEIKLRGLRNAKARLERLIG